MKKNRLLIIIIILIITIISAFNIIPKAINNEPIKAAVLFYREDDYFVSSLKSELLKIENENKDKIDFIFYDGKDNQELQNKQIEEVINMKVDIILSDMVDVTKSDFAINEAKENNIPIIFFHRQPSPLEIIKSYGKSLYIGTEPCDSGIIQGEMIINEWESGYITDINHDNIIDYVLLKGEKNNLDAQARSKCVIKKINEKGIRTIEIASEYCDWERECAKNVIKELVLRYGDTVELIISNNDEMAVGAVLGLQEIGYNKGGSSKSIAVVGIDGTEEAKKLIKDGFMTGTVMQDAAGMAQALYSTGMNLAQGKSPLYNTNYKFDETGIRIIIPYGEYITINSPNL